MASTPRVLWDKVKAMLLTLTRGVNLTQVLAVRGFIELNRDRDGDRYRVKIAAAIENGLTR